MDRKKYNTHKMIGTKLVKNKDGKWKDVCSGDSGGPLVYLDHQTQKNILVGKRECCTLVKIFSLSPA